MQKQCHICGSENIRLSVYHEDKPCPPPKVHEDGTITIGWGTMEANYYCSTHYEDGLNNANSRDDVQRQ
jgi:hypothetical protein